MSRIDQLREQIDACRTGGDDLLSPDLAELAQAIGEGGAPADPAIVSEFDRSQRFDRAVVSALQDVAVPAGMLERLLAKTAAAGRRPAGILAPAVDAAVKPPAGAPTGDVATVAPAAATATPATLSRRWVLAFAVAVAAGIIAVAFALSQSSQQNIELAQLADDAQRWNSEARSRSDWYQTPPGDVLKIFPVDPVLRGGSGAVAKWRRFGTVRGETAIAYDLSSGPRDRAILFVVKTPHHYVGVPSAPPLTPLPGTTGGLSVGAWQTSTGLLYVLVVEGRRPLSDYLRASPLG
jgi:hypothetical protein